MKKKILIIIMLAALLLSVCSCLKEGEDEVTTTESSSEIITTEAEQYSIPLTDGDNALYTVINKKTLKSDAKATVLSLNGKLAKKANINFTRAVDDVYEGVDYSGKYEILFGAVNREESRSVYASIGFDGYAVKSVGNKIVIAAYTPQNLRLAADAFINQATAIKTVDGKEELYYVKDIVVTGNEGLFFTEENPLSSYKIVYTSRTRTVASAFVSAISEYTGIRLEYYEDSKPEQEFEILIGETNRKESQEGTPKSLYDYSIKAVGKKLVIRNGDAESYSDFIADAIINEYLYNSHSLNFPANVDISEFRYSGDDRILLDENADIRIMSFNILSEEWASNATMTPTRIAAVAGCIKYYKPDVIGIQEVSRLWHVRLIPKLEDEYVFLNTGVNGGVKNCYTVLAFRKDTVEMQFNECINYSCGNNRIRVLNIGVFKHKASGRTFVVSDTHLDAGSEEFRVVHATEHLAIVKDYIAKYKCPVITVGDYNSKEGSDPYNIFSADGFMKRSDRDAYTVGNISATIHGMGSAPSSNATSVIDYIWYNGDITPLYYSTLSDSFLHYASDHCPIMTDFKFN